MEAFVKHRLQAVKERIRAAERRFSRHPGSVRVVAVSKRFPAECIQEALEAGQRHFGESYLQEAVPKMEALAGKPIQWHFIGRLQANKTREVARRFQWVHSLDRLKLAQRLSEQRPPALPPLNVCLQVNVSGEAQKGGVPPEEVPTLAEQVAQLPGLRLRGLMVLPAMAEDFEAQRAPFRRLREIRAALEKQGMHLDTLSMGMSRDLEAAIAEGATLVRVGSAIFGPRPSL